MKFLVDAQLPRWRTTSITARRSTGASRSGTRWSRRSASRPPPGSGYLFKDADEHELLQAVRTVALGGVIFSPEIAHKVLQYLSESASHAPPDPAAMAFDELTNREREILDLLTRGLTDAEVAHRLGLSPRTVSNNVSKVMLKVEEMHLMRLPCSCARCSCSGGCIC